MTPAPLALRRARPADASAIRDLTRSVYAKWVPVIGREPRPMTADYEYAVSHHWIEVYEDRKGLVALIELIPGPGFLLIENVAVHEGSQGKGIATALLSRADEIARALKLGEIRLYTNAAFAENLRFYFNRGFRESAREPLPDGGTMVHFRKPVS